MTQFQLEFGSELVPVPRPVVATQDERAARDAALEKVSESAGDDRWSEVLAAFRGMTAVDFIGEDIRFSCEAAGITAHTPKFWGAVVNYLVRQKLIEPTGEYLQMQSPGSHGRESKVYRKT